MFAFQLDQAQTLVTLVDEGSFEATARVLHITPSAVSQRVRALEEATGSVLVERGQPVTPTAAGLLALRFARALVLLAQDATAALTSTSDTGETLLPVAVNGDSLATWFVPALSEATQRTGALFDVRREDEQLSARSLRRGEVMAAITSNPANVQGCTSTALGVMRYRAVASPTLVSRWSSQEAGFLIDRRAPMVNFDRDDMLQRHYLREKLGWGTPPPSHYIPSSADFAQAIAAGLGWGLLPEQQIADFAPDALVALDAGRFVDVTLYWQRWRLSSPTLDAVTEVVREVAARHLRPLGDDLRA